MDRSINAGIIGIVLAVFLSFSIPVGPPLDFLPSFVIVIFVIYVFRLLTLKDGLVASFMTYLFNIAIVSTVSYASYYNGQFPAFTVNVSSLLDPLIYAVSAIVAAYIGVYLARKRAAPPQKTPQQQTDIPPDLQTV
jgi:hypothetical protein